MPRALFAWNKLYDFSVPAYQKMGGNPETTKSLIIGMSLEVESVGKKINHAVAPKLIRRQADVMDHQQAYRTPRRALVRIGGSNKACPIQAAGRINPHSMAVFTRCSHAAL